jgi:CBS domain-containing protein
MAPTIHESKEAAMGLKGLMKTPPATLLPGASVLEACRIMNERKLSAVAVVEERKLRGILTQGDVLARVVLPKRDPEKVKISEVMTKDVVTITAERSFGDALRLMVERGHNVLPVIEKDGDEELAGMLTLPELLKHEIDHLANELDAVTSYFTADGAGGD